MNCLVLTHQHYSAWKATQRYDMSFGEYVGALIDRAEGRPNKLDGMIRATSPAEGPQQGIEAILATKTPSSGF